MERLRVIAAEHLVAYCVKTEGAPGPLIDDDVYSLISSVLQYS